MNARTQEHGDVRRRSWALVVSAGTMAVFLALGGARARADMISFNHLAKGEVLSDQFSASHGVTFSARNHACGHPDTLVIFDTESPSGGDYDLAYPWAGGNLGQRRLEKIFVIAENVRDCNHDGLVDNPDDEARGGVVKITFDFMADSFGFVQVDRDDCGGDKVKFYKNGTLLDVVTYAEMATMDSTIDYGNRKANRLPMITDDMVGDVFDEVRIEVTGSHGFDNIAFTQAIPEPMTMTVLAMGAGLLLLRRRRAA